MKKRKPRLSETEVTKIALAFLAAQGLGEPEYKWLSTAPDKLERGKWVVLFRLYTPNGAFFDGPVVVMVDDAAGTAEFFLSL